MGDGSAWEAAARWHIARCPGGSLAEVVEAHLQGGHVVSSPRAFVMVRRVWRAWPEDRLGDPWDVDPAGDCWHVWLFAGDPAMAPRLAGWLAPVPWLSYHRRGRRRTVAFPRWAMANGGPGAAWSGHGIDL